MQALIIYALFSTALFYLGSRATITSWLWSRYPPLIARFLDCSACSGTWYGFFLAATIGRYYGLNVFMFDSQAWTTPIFVGIFTMVLTPMVAGLMQHAINVVGSAVELEQHDLDVRHLDEHDKPVSPSE